MKKINASELIELDDPFIDSIVDRVCYKLGSKKIGETYSVKEVSGLVKRDLQTVRRHIREGLLQANKTGKSYIITEQQLKQYIS